MPDEETPVKASKPIKASKPEVIHESAQNEPLSEPYTRVLASNSPWKVIHSDNSINTYALEIVGIGVIIRSESPGTNSESSVFIPNIKLSDLPNCQ